MARSTLRASISSFFGLILVAGCSGSGSLDQTATYGDDMGQTEGDTETLASLHVGANASGELAPASLAAGGLHILGDTTLGTLAQNFTPSGCVTETLDVSASKATYVYDGCTGPWGLATLTGTVDITYSSTGSDNLTLNFSATNFQINRATLSSWMATAVVTADGTERSMTWNAQLSGTTAGGRTFSRTNSKNISWTAGATPRCVSVTGSAEGTVSGLSLKTTVVSYQRCQAACPDKGSEVDIENTGNSDEVVINYLGGDAANVTLKADGRTAELTIPLACGL